MTYPMIRLVLPSAPCRAPRLLKADRGRPAAAAGLPVPARGLKERAATGPGAAALWLCRSYWRPACRSPGGRSRAPGRNDVHCPGRLLQRQGHPPSSAGDLCRPSGPEDEGQAEGQARRRAANLRSCLPLILPERLQAVIIPAGLYSWSLAGIAGCDVPRQQVTRRRPPSSQVISVLLAAPAGTHMVTGTLGQFVNYPR